MRSLKNPFAALGFVCFSSLALLPVGMTICGPIASRLLHPAKKIQLVKPSAFPAIAAAQPARISVNRDVIRVGTDPLRNLFEHIAAGGTLTARDADGSRGRLIKRLIRGVHISLFVFQAVLNL
jgi:hypothetical protein